jgi:putative DNA primase/helicase
LIEAIFEDTIAAVPLQDFSKEFGLQPLIDKKVNLLFDLPIETIHETGQIKAITGEDSITINRKYKDPITTKLKCKVIGAGNRLPLIKDDSFAFWRRIVILHLTKRFEGKNRDVKLKEKLINDKEGMSWLIYNSIKAYKEVEEIGWQEDTYKLVRESFLKESNPALYAAEKLFDITVEPDDFLSKKEITEKINAYLRDNKIKIPAKINEYYEAVKHVGAKLGQKTVKNQKIHGFRYIKQRNPQ